MTTTPIAPTAQAGVCPVSGTTATVGATCPVAHGPKGLPVLGVSAAYAADPVNFVLSTQRSHGSVVPLRLISKPVLQVTDAGAIDRVLRANADNYRRGDFYEAFRGYMGEGLLTLDTERWRGHRAVLNPVFTAERVRQDAAEAVAATTAVLDTWPAAQRAGRPIDLVDAMMDITGRVIGKMTIGADLGSGDRSFARATEIALKVIFKTVGSLEELVPSFVPTRYHRQKRWAHRVLNGIIGDTIAARRATGDLGTDAIGRLLASDLPEQAVYDDLRTLFLAGAETTGLSLAWTLYELARHPEVRREVEDEVDRVLGDGPATPDLFGDLVVTRSAIDEALRLYPPVWQFPRDAVADDTLRGHPVRGGDTVLVSVVGTHRNPEYWSDPEAFDPARFRTPAPDRPRGAYLPFGGGRRQCIGKPLAMATLLTGVAMVSRRFRLSVVGGQRVRPHGYITLFPKDGIKVDVRTRS